MIKYGKNLVDHSDFVSEVNENCQGCGKCLKRCYFEAREIIDKRAVVNLEKCMGCGLCATGCPNEATFLTKI